MQIHVYIWVRPTKLSSRSDNTVYIYIYIFVDTVDMFVLGTAYMNSIYSIYIYAHTYITLHYIRLDYTTLHYITYIHTYIPAGRQTDIHTCMHAYIHTYTHIHIYHIHKSFDMLLIWYHMIKSRYTHWFYVYICKLYHIYIYYWYILIRYTWHLMQEVMGSPCFSNGLEAFMAWDQGLLLDN